MFDVILDSFKDSIKMFFFVLIACIVFSFFDYFISNTLKKKNKISPLLGALFGLIPQCGVSVVSSDLYLKRSISIGTLIAVFLACNDEALILLITSDKTLMSIPLLILKLLIGFSVGLLIDLIVNRKQNNKLEDNVNTYEIKQVQCSCGCCYSEEDDTKFDIHLWRPFIHSLKITGFVLLFNLIFGFVVYFIGADNIAKFLEYNKYISPLFTTLVGLIPNCASSLIITELYINSTVSFGALLAGLLVNSGVGLMMILKNKNRIKDILFIILTLVTTSLICGYLTCVIFGF